MLCNTHVHDVVCVVVLIVNGSLTFSHGMIPLLYYVQEMYGGVVASGNGICSFIHLHVSVA